MVPVAKFLCVLKAVILGLYHRLQSLASADVVKSKALVPGESLC